MQTKPKVMIITGASSGIGQAIAAEAVKKGYNVCIAGRDMPKLLQTETFCVAINPRVNLLKMSCDVSVELECKQLIESCFSHFGQIDVLVNNAGISMRALFIDVEMAVLHKLMNVNFWGMVYCSKYALPYLLASKGSLVGISSIAGYKGLPARAAYSASKAAMNSILEVIRIENMYKGLHVLTCAPGFTASNIRQTALNSSGNAQAESPLNESKLMQADEVAEKLLNAINKRKNTLILTTQGKLTVWVNKFFPIWLNKKVYDHMANEPDSPLEKRA
ncbi:MAG: SDR family oxidoreductase [Bacteroidota bacterium]|nr:SDR family oxidoreductase [Bacteroidota bacterium]